MSILYRIDEKLGTAFAQWNGVVTAEEFLTHAQHLLSDPAWPPAGWLHLTDVRNTTPDASVDEGAIAKIAHLYGEHPKIANLKMAIVATDTFRKAMVFENVLLGYHPSVIVFNSLETACTWLGIDAEHAEQTLAEMRAEARAAAKPGAHPPVRTDS